jgi:chlorite dismutase
MSRVTFIGGAEGEWIVERNLTICGEAFAHAPRLQRIEADDFLLPGASTWVLHGVRSHERYTSRGEKNRLAAIQESLSRPASTRAALIPIKKSAEWWALAQDERRAIFEERSRHITVGSEYLPAIARRLYHCRDLGGPFDFLTWFEYAPADEGAFDELVGRLRATEEWSFIVREAELRLTCSPSR